MQTVTIEIATVAGTRTETFNFRVRPALNLVRFSGLTAKDSGLAVDVKNATAKYTSLDLASPTWNTDNGFWEAAILA